MRLRKQLITNLYVNSKDITKLANGYVIYKRANHHAHCIIPKSRVLRAKIDSQKRVIEDKIQALKNKPAKVAGTEPVKLITGTRAKYTKKNPKYWEALSAYMRKHHTKKGFKYQVDSIT